MATPRPSLPLKQTTLHRRSALSVSLADTDAEIEQCLRLRYSVFADEMGASLKTSQPGVDQDRFDPHCKHLMVRDNTTGEVVGTTRLLMDTHAAKVGMYYSETEFRLDRILALPGRFMEVGRTCIHRDYRRGTTLAMLWHGIAQVVVMNRIDYLIGCASIELGRGDEYVHGVLELLRRHHFAEEGLRVEPLIPLPHKDCEQRQEVVLPTLLKGYLRLGAMICGEPYWDAAFNVADVFILVNRDQLARRYVKHFVNRV